DQNSLKKKRGTIARRISIAIPAVYRAGRGGETCPLSLNYDTIKKKRFSDFISAIASLSLSNLDAFLQVLVACEPGYALRPPVQS
ncbi:MAG: hypothetical protein MR522_08225, partial [Trueperella sp.]|uniref:hypothetical protein n=1 Tax=Trueperella sp. TaxID=2699835 RepID=UPI0025ED8A3E